MSPSANLTSRRAWIGMIALSPHLARSAVRVYDVRDFGAKGDGVAVDTVAVQAAIDACARNQGGSVLVPTGNFVIGTVELKSNVTLHVAEGGSLVGSGDASHYSAGKGVPPGNGNVVMLYAVNADNVTIEGRGSINGSGEKFYIGKGDNTGPGGNFATGYSQRPHLVIFYNCRNVLVRDIFLTRSAYHCMRVLECRYVRLDGVRIHNRANTNNDGFHLNSNQHVNISNCDVACQDDACALFGSNRYVTITNSTFSTRWSVFRFGGGDAQDIAISNCVIYETYGCPIKIRVSAGSRIENASFSNLIMDRVTGPISVGLDTNYHRTQPDSRAKGVVRNLSFSNIRANVVATGGQFDDMAFKNNFRPGETRQCIVLNGVGDDFLEEITLSDIYVKYEGGGTQEEARREMPKIAGEYFEVGTPNAYGLYARNVRGLTLRGVRLETASPDLRPAMVFDHVEDASVMGLSAQGNPKAESLVRMIDTRDILISSARVVGSSATFLKVEGSATSAVTIDGGDLSKAATPLLTGDGVPKNAVKVREAR